MITSRKKNYILCLAIYLICLSCVQQTAPPEKTDHVNKKAIKEKVYNPPKMVLNTKQVDTREPKEILEEMVPDKRVLAQLKAFPFFMIAYRWHTGGFPTQEEGLDALLTEPGSLNGTSTWQGPYADELFINDPWGNPFIYKWIDGESDLYNIISLGPDGVSSKDDLSIQDVPSVLGFTQREIVDVNISKLKVMSENEKLIDSELESEKMSEVNKYEPKPSLLKNE